MFCDTPLLETNQTVLECGHKGHFRCIMIHFGSHYHMDISSKCPSCNIELVGPVLRQEIFDKVDELQTIRWNQENTQFNPVTNLLDSSEEFRKDMKELRVKYTTVNKNMRIFTLKTNEHYTAFTNQIKEIMTVLKGTHKEALKRVSQMTEYKNTNKASLSFKSYIRKLCRKYDITERMLYSHFRRNTRRFFGSSWHRRTNLRDRIRRKFRIRIF
jgi:hypothetical protein